MSAAGTSPRVRGKRAGGPRPAPRRGYIPACAGEAGGRPGARPGTGVHPRVCGGSPRSSTAPATKAGTSPRVRGKPQFTSVEGEEVRYIPACAGEAARRPLHHRPGAVHPRVCGGSSLRSRISSSDNGTSPRVRGKRRLWNWGKTPMRYIPACAGEALQYTQACIAWRVHPRVCGGSATSSLVRLSSSGTSPRVRGKLVDAADPRLDRGYIPACAGEARLPPPERRLGRVHPRVCGGSPYQMRSMSRSHGTSPRVRGKHPPPPLG